jgi:hypothetical protein
MKPQWCYQLVSLLLLPLVCAIGASGPAREPAQPPQVRTVTIAVPGGNPQFTCWEPHIAVDAENPERVLLSAIFGGEVGAGETVRADTRLFTWQSEDGARTWTAPIAPFGDVGRPPGRIGADPVVAFGIGKTCWLAGCDYDYPQGGGKFPARPKLGYQSIKVCRSADGGRTWESPISVAELDNDKNDKGVLDKPWMAVDRSNGQRQGTVYVAWTKLNFDNRRSELWCAALPADGRQFSPAVRLGTPIEQKDGMHRIHQVQLAVRPDGTLDAIWKVAPSSRLVHATSQDGGATFSEPAAISDDETSGSGQFPSLAVARNGNLLAGWARQGNVFVSVRASGRWSVPRPVIGDLPEGVRLSHPATAASDDALWVLAYRREKPARVKVVLYRGSGGGRKWDEYCTLASRDLSQRAASQFSPGDYVGIAATQGRIYAAYVLPAEDSPRPRLYVSTVVMPQQP